MISLKSLLISAVLVLLALPASGQDVSVSPGVNRAYHGADYARWQSAFETEGREVFEQRDRIIDTLAITPGMTVADVGAGTGAFSVLLARKVGAGGTAIAQDVTPEFIRGIAARAKEQKLPQLKTVLGAYKDARLPAGVVDLVFTCDTYHHFEYPQAMLASLHAALKPGGRLIVIDYQRIPGSSSPWVLGHVRAGRDTVVAEIEAAGFALLRSHDFLRENYFLEFTRR
jgi:ubiquinone/menaquinone biosynthesis C-methylase UbiE